MCPWLQPIPWKVKVLYLVEDSHSNKCGAFISHDLSGEGAQRTTGLQRETSTVSCIRQLPNALHVLAGQQQERPPVLLTI